MVSFRFAALLVAATFPICALAANGSHSTSTTALAALATPRQENTGHGDSSVSSSPDPLDGGDSPTTPLWEDSPPPLNAPPNSPASENASEGTSPEPSSPDPVDGGSSPQTPSRGNSPSSPRDPPRTPGPNRLHGVLPAAGASGRGLASASRPPRLILDQAVPVPLGEDTSSPDSPSPKSPSSNSSSPKRPRPHSPLGGDKPGPSTKSSDHPRPRSFAKAFGGSIPGSITGQGKALISSPDSPAPPPGSSSEPRVRFSKDK